MEGQKLKVVHVHLKTPLEDGRADFYFGSFAAIYTVLNREHIGYVYGSLYQKMNGKTFMENKRCTIRVAPFITKPKSKPHEKN